MQNNIKITMNRDWGIDDYHYGSYTEYRLIYNHTYVLPERLALPLLYSGFASEAQEGIAA